MIRRSICCCLEELDNTRLWINSGIMQKISAAATIGSLTLGVCFP